MKIILFDGNCNFCDLSVQFILKRDKKEAFHFAALRSETGRKLRDQLAISDDKDSLIFVHDDHYYDASSAALRICKDLRGLWKLFYFFLIIPKPLRDFAYHLIAKNRYLLFGYKTKCNLPPAHIRKRFLN